MTQISKEAIPLSIIMFFTFVFGMYVSNETAMFKEIENNFQSQALHGDVLSVDDIDLKISKNTVSVNTMSLPNNKTPIFSSLMCTNTNQWFYAVEDISSINLANPMQEIGKVNSITNAELIIGKEKFPIILKTKNFYGAWPFVELDERIVKSIKFHKIVQLNYKNSSFVYDFRQELKTLYAYSNICKQ